MNTSGRFTAYLSPVELAKLEEMATSEGCSKNYLVRSFVRAGLGFPVPRWVLRTMMEASNETTSRVLR